MYILRIYFKSLKKNNKFKTIFKKNEKIKNSHFFKVKNKNKIFTLLKSPHVNKKSREHFILKNYSQKINLEFFNFYQLINFLIFIKKKNAKNIIQTKIIKKCL